MHHSTLKWHSLRRYVSVILTCASTFTVTACDEAAERAVRHHDRGLALIESGSREKAILEFRNALRLDEGFVAARFELAKLLEETGDLRAAIANLNAVAETDPAHAGARIRLAKAMLMANEPEQAMEHAEIAVRAAPTRHEALIARGMAAYRLGDVRIALADARQALLFKPDFADAGLLLAIERRDAGDLDQAHKILETFIASNPRSASLHLAKLGFLSQAQDHDAVELQIARMIHLFPRKTDFRRLMVQHHLNRGNTQAAELELAEISRLAPDDPAPVLARGRLIEKTRGLAAAWAFLNSELPTSSSPRSLQLELARIEIRNGETTAAETRLREIFEHAASDENGIKAGLLLTRLYGSEQDFSAVVRISTELLEHDPGNAEALALRAVANLRHDSIENALQDIRNALAEQPENPRYLGLAGEIYERNGSPKLAGESLSSAVRASNHSIETVLNYARFLQAAGEDRPLEALLKQALRKNPNAVEIASALTQLYLQHQDWDRAEAIIRHIADLDATLSTKLSAEIAIRRRNFDAALAAIERLVDVQQAGHAVKAARIRILAGRGDQVAARKLIEDGLLTEPTNTLLLGLDAALHEMNHDLEIAEESYRKLLAVTRETGSGHAAMAAFLDRNDRSHEAREVLNDGLRLAPKSATLRMHVAAMALRSNNPSAAITEFEQIYSDWPNSMLAANNLASVLADHANNDPEQIARAAKIARRLAGSANPAFKDTYGWTQVLSGNVEQGLVALQSASSAMPQNPWVKYHIGMAYLEVGDEVAATEHFKAALDLTAEKTSILTDRIRQALAVLSNQPDDSRVASD